VSAAQSDGFPNTPPEWSVVPLAELVEYVTYGFTNPMPDSDVGPFKLTAKDVIDGRIAYETARHTTWEAYNDLLTRKSRPARGDILLTKDGSIGRVAIVDRDDVCINQSVAVMRPRAETNGRFLYYLLRSPYYQQRMAADADGSTIKHIYITRVDKMLVAVPPPTEQQSIAEVLGTLDETIDQNHRVSAALERLARAIFRAWFVDFEPVKAKAAGATSFPSISSTAFAELPTHLIDSDLGPVPEGWSLKPLYDTAQFINGAAFKGEHFCDPSEGLPVVKIAELKYGITAQTGFSNRHDLDAKYRIDTGELLYSWSGNPDTSLDAFLWTKGPALLNQHIFRVMTKSNAQRYFVYYLLKHLRQPLIEIARDKQTTGLGHVTVADMRKLMVCWPAERIFEAFERHVGPIFEKSFALTMESEKLAEIRDYLLPKLLSGAIRVRDVARASCP
jgi:type I restriction enzyme, S subunit